MPKPKRSPKPKKEEAITIKLKWQSADNLPTVFANHLVISHATRGEFYLFFGEFVPPNDLDNPPAQAAIVPVAKIVISPQNMLLFADVINDNVNKFRDKLIRAQTQAESE